MSVEIVSGKLVAANAVATNVECGFIPDLVQSIKALGGTEKHYKWHRVLYEHAVAATGKYGYCIDIAPVPLASAAAGFIPYNTAIDSVLLPAPDADGVVPAPTCLDYNVLTTYVARDLSAGVEILGSCVRPTTHNGFVYECVVASGGASGAEPTWGTTLGGRTVAASGDEWICREERTVRRGVKGFTIGATLSVDGEYWVFDAQKHDRFNYMGDADVENPVTFGEHMR